MSFNPFLIPKHSGIFLEDNPTFVFLDNNYYQNIILQTYFPEDLFIISDLDFKSVNSYYEEFIKEANKIVKKGNIIIHSDNLDFIRYLINSQDNKKLNLSIGISTGTDFNINIDNYDRLLNINNLDLAEG